MAGRPGGAGFRNGLSGVVVGVVGALRDAAPGMRVIPPCGLKNNNNNTAVKCWQNTRASKLTEKTRKANVLHILWKWSANQA